MEKRILGKSGIEASNIGLGTYYFGGGDGTSPPSSKDIIDMIHSALDHSINLMDTAPAYGFGHCEKIIGKALKGRRDQAVIATKCGLWWQDRRGSPNGQKDGRDQYISLRSDTIRIEVENSLRYLNTDYLDLLQVHKPAIPPEETPIEETMACLMELKQEGKIRAIGVCNVSLEQLQRYDSAGELATNQFRYSMIHKNPELDILPYCLENDIGSITYMSLEQGLLTGKINFERKFEDHDWRNNAGQWLPWFKKENLERLLNMFSLWEDLLDKYTCSIAQLTLAWSAAQPGATHILCGAKSVDQVISNAKSGFIVLSDSEIQRLNQDINNLGDPI